MDDTTFKENLRSILGPKGWLEDADAVEPYITEWRGFWRGACMGVARPASTQQTTEVVALCAQAGISIVPQGGNTGLVGGGVPYGGIVLSTQRMNTIRSIDPINQSMVVEAGCILADVQAAAEEAGLYFPLSLGAEGTCRIGGNLSTNAGGVAVLRYGNARDLTLGLEVVLPSGEVWDGLKALRKDNSGYDMKQLFIGAEGTLGIITACVIKLFPRPLSRETAIVALPNIDAALDLFVHLRASAGGALTAFEFIADTAFDLVEKHIPGTGGLFAQKHGQYALIELTSPRADDTLRTLLENCLEQGLEQQFVADGVIAENEAQAATFWRIRESIPEAQVLEGASVKHDVSVPISSVVTFIKQASDAVSKALPGTRIVAFGHMGDGNIHFNLSQPTGMDGTAFLEQWDGFNRVVHDIAVALGGSFSAEHGIGQLKRKELAHYAAPLEIELMRCVKQALDPQGIMNPGKTIPS